MKMKSEREVAQSCPTLSNPMDSSLPGSSIHGIFQARVLEWGAIAFSEFNTSQALSQKDQEESVQWVPVFVSVEHRLLTTSGRQCP